MQRHTKHPVPATRPCDLAEALASLPKGQRPTGWGKHEIVILLGTADVAEAKRKHAEVAAEVERRFAILRSGARQQSQKEANARATSRHRSLLEAVNSGKAPRFATDGLVGGDSFANFSTFAPNTTINLTGPGNAQQDARLADQVGKAV